MNTTQVAGINISITLPTQTFNIAVDGTGNLITVTGASGTGLTYQNTATITQPTPPVTEVDVIQGANTEKFIPDPNATATVGATTVTTP